MRRAIASVLLVAAGCINFADVVNECAKPGGRCAPVDGGAGGGGGGSAGGGAGGGVDAGDAGDAGSDAGTDAGVDAGFFGDAGPACAALLCLRDETVFPGVEIFGVDAVSDDDVWAVGGNDAGFGVVWHWDGTKWADVTPKTPPDFPPYPLKAVDAVGPHEVWAVGLEGTIIHWVADAGWTSFRLGVAVPFRSVWVPPDGRVYVAGGYQPPSFGKVYRLTADAGDFVDEGSFNTVLFHSVWGTASDDVWVAGERGGLAHKGGAGWQLVDAGTRDHFLSIWGSGPHDVWFSTDQGNVWHFDGGALAATLVNDAGEVREVSGANAGSVWATGGLTNSLFHFDGGEWGRASPGMRANGPFNVRETTRYLFTSHDEEPNAVMRRYRLDH